MVVILGHELPISPEVFIGLFFFIIPMIIIIVGATIEKVIDINEEKKKDQYIIRREMEKYNRKN